MRWAALLLLSACLPFVCAQDYGSGIPIVAVQPAAAGGGPGLTVLHRMDFEGSGCADSGTDTGATFGGTCDCDSGADADCPITGTYSGAVLTNLDSTYSSTLSAVTTGFVTLDARVSYSTAEAGSWEGIFGAMSVFNFSYNYECYIQLEETNDQWRAASNNATGTGFDVTQDTDYYIRLVYDVPNDDCDLYVSTSAYGASDVGSSTANGSIAGSVIGWEFNTRESKSTTDIRVDDIVLCSGDAGTTEGQCDTE